MGRHKKDDSVWVVKLFGIIIGLWVVGIILKILLVTAVFAVPACLISALVLKLVTNNKISGLPWLVRNGDSLGVLSALILVIAGAMQIYDGFFAKWPSANEKEVFQYSLVTLTILGGLLLGAWIIWRTKAVQQKLAGLRAEEQVKRFIDEVHSEIGGHVRHGALLVFRSGMEDEYSVEIDHLLVTKRNVYVVETKYKSGRINARENAPRWTVETSHATSDMRNGLLQAKNTIDTLRRSIDAFKGARVVPLVAVVGNNVEIINGPSNVVEASNLRRVVGAFEANTKGNDIDVEAFMAAVQAHVSTDKKALVNHISRANAKEAARREEAQKQQEQAEFKKIVSEASTNLPKRHQVAPITRADGSSPRDSDEIVYQAETARHNFNALAGMQNLKDQLLEAAQSALLQRGDSDGLAQDVRNGILLHGEPGNGKTLIAEALAGTLELPIIRMSFGSVASKFINQTTEQIVQLFNDARKQSPCVLFMDEVDSVICSREFTSGATEEGPKITNQILTELVELRGTGVVIVMATNYLERLDVAAIREGRVDFKIEVPSPDAPAREALITNRVLKAPKAIEVSKSTLELAVKRWEGFSASRIVSVIDESLRKAIRESRSELLFDDLQAAMKKIQGALGDRLSEDTPLLNELHMPDAQARSLLGIAKRMTVIEKVEAMGGSVPTGLLLAGPPGTGKTLAVRSLAKTTGWPLISSSGADLLSDAKKIDELIKRARNARPCLVFIDEADDVFSNRRTRDIFSASMTNKLLTAIDGISGKPHGILWVIAVNGPDTLDPAALRGGRFTEKIWFDNPETDVSTRIISQWLEKTSARFDASLTPEALADALDGTSQANITAILQQAVNHMIARSDDTDLAEVGIEDVASAKRTILGTA